MATDAGSFEIIDLSDGFYREKGEPTPSARCGKFVVMRNEADDAEYLVLSPAAQSVYHTNIVERFCRLERFGIPGHFLKKGGQFVIDDMDWIVCGGGKWDMDEEKQELRLHGSSQAYGTYLLVDLTNRVAGVPAMAGWRILPY